MSTIPFSVEIPFAVQPDAPTDVLPDELVEIASVTKPLGVPDNVNVQYHADTNAHVQFENGKTATGLITAYNHGEQFTVGTNSTRYNASDVKYIRET